MANTVISFKKSETEDQQKISSPVEIYTDISRESVYGVKFGRLFKDLYKDSTLSNKNYKVTKSVNLKAVSNALHNIFEFFPGERVLYPEFGSKLKLHLYNGITIFNQEQIVTEIYADVELFDKRIVVDDILIVTSDEDKDDNTVVLRILYHIDGLPETHYSYDYSYIAGQ